MTRRVMGTVVVMGRLPQLGVGKRRLARDIGNIAARRFYGNTLGSLLRRLAGDSRWRVRLAITPDRAVWQARGLPGGVRVIPQGRGDLGQRMGRLLEGLFPGPVVIVGSDIPDLKPRHIAQAFRILGARDWVFGPARDGGYWLVGAASRPARRKPSPFDSVRWSSPHALADTLAGLKGASYALLETLEDVDSGDDLARLRERLSRRPRGVP